MPKSAALRYLRATSLVIIAASLHASGAEFEPNFGQADSRYPYLARAGTTHVYIEENAVELHASSGRDIRLIWAGARNNSSTPGAWSISNATGNTSYYCNQPDADLCRKPVPSYNRLVRKNLYSKIDWVLHGADKQQFEYDLVIHPGGDLRQARFRIQGAPAELTSNGALRTGDILHWRPVAWQWANGKKTEVDASLVQLENGEFGFAVGPYRRDLDLTIDPVLEAAIVAGGQDEDTMVGTASGRSCSYRYGITRSADWSHSPGTGDSVFAQLTRTGQGTENFFWGGGGEFHIGGSDTDLNNCRLYLVGWTNSQTASTRDARFDQLYSRPYGGGATDGFFLEFAWGGLAFASYIGGPGADRVYDVRRTAPTGYNGPFVLVGETDDSNWPASVVTQTGPGGRSDAFVASVNGLQLRLWTIGGSGNDRAIRLRSSADSEYWTIGGETDSSDFPSTDGPQKADGTDLWAGRIQTDLTSAPVLRLFGGSGNEQLGAMAVLDGRGLYLAGTTNSPALPTAVNSSHGGASDGFLAVLDPMTAAPVAATFIGGSGHDEITAMATDGSVLYLGGSTDSADIALPGMTESAAGGLDGLFVESDASAVPVRGFRFGGSADDRVLGVEPVGLGQVRLAGASQSRDWVRSLDADATGLGGQDGFAISFSFADVRLSAGELWLGQDLQRYVQIRAVSEAGMDGILVVRSTDPGRLLVSAAGNLPGTEQILLNDVSSGNSPPDFFIHALADSGEVDVVVEGRSGPSPNGVYPRQTLRVKLAPSRLFVSSPRDVTLSVGNSARISYFHGAMLPDGSPGPAADVRYGMKISTDLSSSDPARLTVLDSPRIPTPNVYEQSVKGVVAGDYTLTPTSSLFVAAPGQAVTVHVLDAPPIEISAATYAVLQGNVAPFYLNAWTAGDSLSVSSDDPSRLLVGPVPTVGAASATLTRGQFFLTVLAGSGTVSLRVTGTYRGRPVSDVMRVVLVPYKATLNAPAAATAVGSTVSANISLTPQFPPKSPAYTYLPGEPSPLVFARVQLESSDPAVLRPENSVAAPLTWRFTAVQPGTATLGFRAPDEFAGMVATVRVVPAALDFGVSVIRIPAGGTAALYPAAGLGSAPLNTWKSVRLRLSSGAPLALQRFSDTTTELTFDFTGQYGVGLYAPSSTAGQQATLFVSAAGIPETSIPIRIVDPVFLPNYDEVRTIADGVSGSEVFFHMAAAEESQTVDFQPISQVPKVTVYPVMEPQGICSAPESVDVAGFGSFSFRITCNSAGIATLTLRPGKGISGTQSRYSVRIVSQAVAMPPVPLASRVLTGNGLQARLSTWLSSFGGNAIPFSGTLTSNDPERVRLSLDSRAPGSASVVVPSDRTVGAVYVQGYASEGVVTLTARTPDGRTGQVTVYLFPSTLAVRPKASEAVNAAPTLSLDRALSPPSLTLSLQPYLVDPGTKKLFWNPGLSVRAGTDPVFVRGLTSDASVAEPMVPDAIVSEADEVADLRFRLNAIGDAVLSATQPEGFIAVPDSSLRLHVFQERLGFREAAVLSADLQTPVNLDFNSLTDVTATSSDPAKLLLSASPSVPGQASVTVPRNERLYLQGLSGVQPGDQVEVRLEAPGYLPSTAKVDFVAAELQVSGTSPVSFAPLTNPTLALVYGPLDSAGRATVNGTVRPGVNLQLQVSSTNPGVLAVAQTTVAFSTSMRIPLRALAPGRAQIQVEAPAGIVNRASAVDAVVTQYQFPYPQAESASRYLVSKFTIINPRPQPATVIVESNGNPPIRLGTAASGPGAPTAASLNVTLAANETRSLYLEPAGAGYSPQFQMTAPDFSPQTGTPNLQDPLVSFLDNGPVSLASGGPAVPLTVALYGNSPKRELPLGTSYGPLSLQVQSSNPKVVAVPSGPLVFSPGDIRKTVSLQPLEKGEAVVTIVVPPSFAGSSPTRQDIVVVVR